MKHRRPLVTLGVAVLLFLALLLANMIVHPAGSTNHAAAPGGVGEPVTVMSGDSGPQPASARGLVGSAAIPEARVAIVKRVQGDDTF